VSRSAQLALGLGALLAGCGGPAEPPLSAVLITMDTTNRDTLGCYGQALPLSPHLDALAQQSLVFEQCRTVAPLTLPAHTSILTGLVPLRHSVRDNGLLPLAQSAETLAERLQKAGFQTAAFVSAVVLAAPYGLDQGFSTYDAPGGSRGGSPTAHMLERPATETIRAAADWLRARERTKPFFLWVHGFEPHGPYAPPPQFLERAKGDPYLGEIAALDDALGELFTVLEKEQGLERLVLIVSGDHGEGLGDHGERTHSVLCYERMLRVPLIVHLPKKERAGERVATPVCVVDITPTFLAALGQPVPSGLDGTSLLAPSGRGSYFESYNGYLNYGWSPLTGWVDGRTKYLHGSQPELYDLVRDPAESHNLHDERPEDVAAAKKAMAEIAGRPRLELASAALDENLAADVQALGYAGSAGAESSFPEPLEDTNLPPPRTRVEELERFYLAALRYNNGKAAEAIADLEKLVADNPRNSEAINVLGAYLFEQKQPDKALAVLETIPENARERVSVQDLIGHCLEHLGKPAEAMSHFERALALKPGDPHQTKDVERLRGKVPK
jgi:arylsulfatase A-like enzyme